MEHLFRIAFWIFTLSGCLQANPIPLSDLEIKDVQDEVSCLPDSTFYSPTNVEERCITTALACFRTELDVAEDECEDKQYRLDGIRDVLTKLIEKSGPTNSTDCACEKSPQPFNGFLEKMELLVQLHNSISRSRQ